MTEKNQADEYLDEAKKILSSLAYGYQYPPPSSGIKTPHRKAVAPKKMLEIVRDLRLSWCGEEVSADKTLLEIVNDVFSCIGEEVQLSDETIEKFKKVSIYMHEPSVYTTDIVANELFEKTNKIYLQIEEEFTAECLIYLNEVKKYAEAARQDENRKMEQEWLRLSKKLGKI